MKRENHIIHLDNFKYYIDRTPLHLTEFNISPKLYLKISDSSSGKKFPFGTGFSPHIRKTKLLNSSDLKYRTD